MEGRWSGYGDWLVSRVREVTWGSTLGLLVLDHSWDIPELWPECSRRLKWGGKQVRKV